MMVIYIVPSFVKNVFDGFMKSKTVGSKLLGANFWKKKF